MEKFAELFLNTKLFNQLKNQIKLNDFGQTHIVISQDQFSNMLFSRLLAYAIICDNNNYCGVCEQCVKLESGTHPDLKNYSIDKAFVVANATEILDDVYKSSYSGKKVYIINNINLATVPAQNKLLKILEEPPKNVFFILNSNNISAVLPTILSRATKINLLPSTYDELKTVFQKYNLDLNENSYGFGEGYLGNILQFDNDKKFHSVFNKTFNILKNVQKSTDIISYCEDIKKDDMPIFLKSLQLFLSDMLYLKTGNENMVKSSYKDDLQTLKDQFSLSAISEISKIIVQAMAYLNANVNYAIVKDMVMLGLLEAKYLNKD